MSRSGRKSSQGWPKPAKEKEKTKEVVRDMYGFIIRPQYVEEYKKTYSIIYQIEEQERSSKWEDFLQTAQDLEKNEPEDKGNRTETSHMETVSTQEDSDPSVLQRTSGSIGSSSQLWATLRPSLWPVEKALSTRGEREKEKEKVSENGRIIRTQSIPVPEDPVDNLGLARLRRTQSSFSTSTSRIGEDLRTKLLRASSVSKREGKEFHKLQNDQDEREGDIVVDGKDKSGDVTFTEQSVLCGNGTVSGEDTESQSFSVFPPTVAKSEENDKNTLTEEPLSQKSNFSSNRENGHVEETKKSSVERVERIETDVSLVLNKKNNFNGLRRSVSGIPTGSNGGFEEGRILTLRRALSGMPEGEGGGTAVLAEVFEDSKFAWEDMKKVDVENESETDKEEDIFEPKLADRLRELYNLVMLGVPMALRGELWQVFVGTKLKRKEGLYDQLLDEELDDGSPGGQSFDDIYAKIRAKDAAQSWAIQIDKDLQRTFPGHPALDANGRDALQRVLIAYSKKNTDVGYCQGMNFLAGILLLLMPEENAFWTLSGLMEDYLEGYYTDQMIEAQVDQLCFEELVKINFPRLVAHLDMLGVQVTWVSGSWFLSVFVNVLPWESVLRVWDVLLYERNRSMLFRTGLAIFEMHASSLMGTFDPGDAMSLLQSMAGATFDSSRLVFSACVGYVDVDETVLKELREKHRPSVLEMLRERNESLARYQSVNAIRLAAEARAALAELNSSKEENNLENPSPEQPLCENTPGGEKSNEAFSSPPMSFSPPIVELEPEGARRPEVIKALETHRRSLIKHQSMKGENLAAVAAAALAELPSSSTISRSSPSPSGVSMLGSRPSLLRQSSAPKWMLSQSGGALIGGGSPGGGIHGVSNNSPNGVTRSLLRQRSASPGLLQAIGEREDSNGSSLNGNGVTSLLRNRSLIAEEIVTAANEVLGKSPSPNSKLSMKSSCPTFAQNGRGSSLSRQGSLSMMGSPLLDMGVLMEDDEGVSVTTVDDLDAIGNVKVEENGSPSSSGFETEGDETTEDVRGQVRWLKEQLVAALEGQDAAVVRVQELQLALVQLAERLEVAEEQDKTMLTFQVEQLEKEVRVLKEELNEIRERDENTIQDAISRKERQLVNEVDDLLTALAEKEEKLRKEVEEMQQMLSHKENELENLVEVVMHMQIEQKTTEDLRQAAERQVGTQREVISLLVEKNKEAVQRQLELEKRAQMAESMLQAFMAAAPDSAYSTFGGMRGGGGGAPESSPSTPWGQMDDARKQNRLWSLLGYKEEAQNNTNSKNNNISVPLSEPFPEAHTPTARSLASKLESEGEFETILLNNDELQENDSNLGTPNLNVGTPNSILKGYGSSRSWRG